MMKQPKKHSLVPKILWTGAAVFFLGISSILGVFFLNLRDPRLPGLPVGVQILAATFQELTHKTAGLEAGDQILAASGLSTFKVLLMNWESSGISTHPLFRILSDSPAAAGLPLQGGWIISADLGWKGLWAGLAMDHLSGGDRPLLGRTAEPGVVRYHWPSEKESQVRLQVLGNLLLMAPEQDILIQAVQSFEESGTSGAQNLPPPDFPEAGFSFSLPEGWTSDLAARGLPGLRNSLGGKGNAGPQRVNFQADDRRLRADFQWVAQGTANISRPAATVWSLLPLDTVFAAVSLWSPDEFLSLAELPSKTDGTLAWAGDEIGLFYHAGSPDPVIFAGLKDRKKWESIRQGLVAGADNRLNLPDGLLPLFRFLNLAGPEVAYFDQGDFIFFSASDLGLASLKNPGGQTLESSPEFQALSEGTLPEGLLSVYTDLDRMTPPFYTDDHVLLDILRLYSRNLLRIIPQEEGWKVDIRGLRGRSALVRTVPGYPRILPEEAELPVYLLPGSGANPPSLAYGLRNGGLLLQDPLKSDTAEIPLSSSGSPLVFKEDGILYFLPEGTELDALHADGSRVEGYPKTPALDGPLTGLPVPGGLVVISGSRMEFLSAGAGPAAGIFPPLPAAVKGSPRQRFGYLAMELSAPAGTHMLTDLKGRPVKGWPKTFSDSPAGPPVFLKSGPEIHLALLGSEGSLVVTDLQGDPLPGYPVSLPGSYRSSPEVLSLQEKELLVLLDTGGKLVIFDPESGREWKSAEITPPPPEAQITLFDGNRDGKPEIFLSGSQGKIWAWDSQLTPVPDFPVTGAGEPQFADLEGDGFLELIGYDGSRRVYAYTLRY